jgi:hypothetical protein
MAQLVNKVMGDPIGKIGWIVGGKWKGMKYWLRGWVKPSQKGTIRDNRDYLAGKLSAMSYKQMNIRNIMRVLGKIGRINLSTWIDVIYSDYLTRHGRTDITGLNLFIKQNAAILYASMSNKAAIWNESTNKMDLLQMLVSKGDLEPVPSITSAVYTTGTGALVIAFDTSFYTNGLATDLAYVMIAKKPILNVVNWEGSLYMFGPTRGNTKTRADGTVTVTLEAGMTATDLTAYVFFKDAAGTIGYSDSVSKAVAAP